MCSPLTGGLALRVSSAADLLDEKGNERSSKSISPVQIHGSHNPCIPAAVSVHPSHRPTCIVCVCVMFRFRQVQTEADEPSFGSREAKLEGCALQRKAWDKNAEILSPLFTSLRGPLPAADLKRGEHGLSWEERLESVRLKHVFDSSKAEEEAKATMLKAARFGWA